MLKSGQRTSLGNCSVGNNSGSITYPVSAKCARLRRRLCRLFSLARVAHALSLRLADIQHPEVAALQQDLMRIRLKLTLHLKQNASQGGECLPFSCNERTFCANFIVCFLIPRSSCVISRPFSF